MSEARYRRLKTWEKADELARQVYFVTKGFPKEELFGLTSQLRRSAISIPTNIVEGSAREGKREFKHFLNIALGSYAETEYLMEFSKNVGLLSKDDFMSLNSLRVEVGKLLWKLYKSI